MAREKRKHVWHRKGVGLFLALAFVFNLFSVIPIAEHHTKGEGAAHYMISPTDDLSKNPEKIHHNNLEMFGIAFGAIAVPGVFSVELTEFGTEIPFHIFSPQLTSLYSSPPDRPPRI